MFAISIMLVPLLVTPFPTNLTAVGNLQLNFFREFATEVCYWQHLYSLEMRLHIYNVDSLVIGSYAIEGLRDCARILHNKEFTMRLHSCTLQETTFVLREY